MWQATITNMTRKLFTLQFIMLFTFFSDLEIIRKYCKQKANIKLQHNIKQCEHHILLPFCCSAGLDNRNTHTVVHKNNHNILQFSKREYYILSSKLCTDQRLQHPTRKQQSFWMSTTAHTPNKRCLAGR